MQLLLDFVPLLLALIAYKKAGIYAATIVLMVLLPLIPIGQKLLRKPVSQMHVWSAAAVILFGSATLFFRDPRFILVKPTIVYLAFAIGFWAAGRFSGQTVVERMLGDAVSLEPNQWRLLNLAWMGFFATMAVLNLIVAYQFSEATWFNFKVFGATGLMVLFIVGQAIALVVMGKDQFENEENT
ncbi:MAG: inner membrane-spanning protein YciB [Pseudomonadota bacterium]